METGCRDLGGVREISSLSFVMGVDLGLGLFEGGTWFQSRQELKGRVMEAVDSTLVGIGRQREQDLGIEREESELWGQHSDDEL